MSVTATIFGNYPLRLAALSFVKYRCKIFLCRNALHVDNLMALANRQRGPGLNSDSNPPLG